MGFFHATHAFDKRPTRAPALLYIGHMNRKLIGFFKPFKEDGAPNADKIYNAIKEATSCTDTTDANEQDEAK